MFSKSDKRAMKRAYENISSHTAKDFKLKGEAKRREKEYTEGFKNIGMDAEVNVYSHSDTVTVSISNQDLIKILKLLAK